MYLTSGNGLATLIPSMVCLGLMLGIFRGEPVRHAQAITVGLATLTTVFAIVDSADIRVSEAGWFGWSIGLGQSMALLGLTIGGTFGAFASQQRPAPPGG